MKAWLVLLCACVLSAILMVAASAGFAVASAVLEDGLPLVAALRAAAPSARHLFEIGLWAFLAFPIVSRVRDHFDARRRTLIGAAMVGALSLAVSALSAAVSREVSADLWLWAILDAYLLAIAFLFFELIRAVLPSGVRWTRGQLEGTR